MSLPKQSYPILSLFILPSYCNQSDSTPSYPSSSTYSIPPIHVLSLPIPLFFHPILLNQIVSYHTLSYPIIFFRSRHILSHTILIYPILPCPTQLRILLSPILFCRTFHIPFNFILSFALRPELTSFVALST